MIFQKAFTSLKIGFRCGLTVCVHQFSSIAGPYKEKVDKVRSQDIVLDRLYTTSSQVLIDQTKFAYHDINLENAFQLHFDDTRRITVAVFLKYKLTLIDNKLFKLEKP